MIGFLIGVWIAGISGFCDIGRECIFIFILKYVLK